MKYIIFILSLLFFIEANADNLPKWYEEKNEDTKLYLYGFGNGDCLEIAIQSALENVRKKFLEKLQENYENFNINLLNFSNFDVEKKEKINGKYFILINIKRNEIFYLQIRQLNEVIKNINKLYISLEEKNDFVKINRFLEILRLVEEAEDKIKIIKTIDNFDDKNYVKLFRKMKREYNNLLKNLDLEIVFKKEDLSNLYGCLKKNIENNSFVKVDKKSNNKLVLDYIIEKINVNHYNIRVLFFVKLFDARGNLVYYNSFEYYFMADAGFENALRNIMAMFEDDLKNDKIILLRIDDNMSIITN